MKATRQFVSVSQEEAPFDVLWWRRPVGPAAESSAKERSLLDHGERGESGANGRSFLLAISSVRGGG